MTDTVVTSLAAAYTAFDTGADLDRIMLADGIYDVGGTTINLTKTSPTARVSFMAQNRGKARLIGNPITLGTAFTIFDGFDLQYNLATGQYVTITAPDCIFQNNRCQFGNGTGNQKWINVSQARTQILYNEFSNKTSDDTLLEMGHATVTPVGIRVIGNWFHDMTGVGTPLRFGGSQLAAQAVNAEVALNRFENLSADPEIISVKYSFVNIHNNTFLNNTASLVLRQCYNATVDANVFINCGIRMYGRNHVITRNQFFNNSQSAQQMPIVIGNGDVEDYPPALNANYARFTNNRIEYNIIDNGDASNGNLFTIGYSTADNSKQPTNNTIQYNYITASDGTLTKQSNSALYTDNIVRNNILNPTGDAVVGDMPGTGYRIAEMPFIKHPDGTYRCVNVIEPDEIGPFGLIAH